MVYQKSYNPAGVLRDTVLPKSVCYPREYFIFLIYSVYFKYEIHLEGFSEKVLWSDYNYSKLKIPVHTELIDKLIHTLEHIFMYASVWK